MPRKARIDVPGGLYHVMSRGIERRTIFFDDEDYADFQERIAVWLRRGGGRCLAWCLMPNHFHLLLLRGERPLSEIMHHAMTGYATRFNLRYGRAGHLFQNRYKAVMCDLEGYLLELVPYIHLNPLRARMVPDLAGLAAYKWCGHRAAAAGLPDGLLDEGLLMQHFGASLTEARRKYGEVMREKIASGGSADLGGGGLLRSFGGADNVLQAFRRGEKVFSDQRVLGDSGFVEAVLAAADEKLKRVPRERTELLAEAERISGVPRRAILGHIREHAAARGREIYCHLCREDGHGLAEVGAELGISRSGVCRLAQKGRVFMELANSQPVKSVPRKSIDTAEGK